MIDVIPDPGKKRIVAVVDQPGKDVVRIAVSSGYSAAVFQIGGCPVEIIISSDDGEDTWRVRLQEPRKTQSMTITHSVGAVEVVYRLVG